MPPTPTTLIAPTTAPFYLAVGAVDKYGGLPDGSTAMDFIGNTGRFIVKSAAANLAEIELIGGSNTEDGRNVSYLVFGEYDGPGSAQGVVNAPLTVNGTVKATGFTDLDLTISHTRIGVADDLASPMLLMLNADAPTDQKNWVFAALEDSFVFSAASDTGEDYFWMVANRSGTTVTDVTFTPPVIAPYLVANGPVPARAALPDGAVAINYSDPVAYIWSKSLGGGLGAIELCGVDNTGREAVYLECAEATPGNPSVGIYAPAAVRGAQLNVYYGTPAVNATLDLSAPNAGLSLHNGNPGVTLINPVAPSGARVWREEAQNGALLFSAQGDTGANAPWMQVQRPGASVTEIDFYAPVVFEDPITAPSATFDSCTVDGSPVLTEGFAPETTNLLSGDGEGGFTDTGIAPSNVALLNKANIFTQTQTVGSSVISPTSGSFTQLNVQQGIYADTGSFTSGLYLDGSPVRTFANTGTGGGPPIPETTNLLAGDGEGGFVDSEIGPNHVATWPPAGVPQSTGTAWGTSIAANTLALKNAANTFTTSQTIQNSDSSYATLTFATPAQTGWQIGMGGNSVGTLAGKFYIFDNTSNQKMTMNPGSGDTTFSGVLTASAKSFQIPYPGDPDKQLNHSCLEGPELAVFYRGEAVTAEGSAEITLPDYFEALTRGDGRTVLLTQFFGEDTEAFAQLMASPVVEGKFRVRSNVPAQRFYWEVKAVRSDYDPLRVVTSNVDVLPATKPTSHRTPQPTEKGKQSAT